VSNILRTADYPVGWERYWNSVATRPIEVFWNADPAEAARDAALFADAFDPNLPLLDTGCGDGRHTRALAESTHFRTIIGADIAPSAIRQAQAAASDGRLSFRVLDLLRPEQAAALNEEIGDANVHIRGVLHQFPPACRKTAVESLARLLGSKGTLYLKELTPSSDAYLTNMLNKFGPPPSLARVMDSLFPFGIKWGGLSEAELEELFPSDRFISIRKGEGRIQTTNYLPSGEAIEIPAIYVLLRLRPAARDAASAAVIAGRHREGSDSRKEDDSQ
jgi:SAM-dependent methyltransferase